jgi:hypothetical protein
MDNFYLGHKLNLVSNHYGLKSFKNGAPGAIAKGVLHFVASRTAEAVPKRSRRFGRTRDPRLRRAPRRKGVNRCTPAKNVKLTYLKAFKETR